MTDASPLDLKEKCEPGTTWKDDCNSCFCTENGVAGCTLKRCPPPSTTSNPVVKYKSYYTENEVNDVNFRCQPGKSFTVECNTCGCDEHGKVSWCTLAGCIGEAWAVTRPY